VYQAGVGTLRIGSWTATLLAPKRRTARAQLPDQRSIQEHVVAMSTVGDIAAVITALSVFAATIAGYIQFVVRRAVAAQFDVEFVALGSAPGRVVGDVSCVVTNLGSNVLVVDRVAFRGRAH
jgi:hypothetical protein